MKVNVTIPVLNGEDCLEVNVRRVVDYALENVGTNLELVVAENGSTDRTLELARGLARASPCIRIVRIEESGRGRALKRAWLESEANVLTYMDLDLSSDLAALPDLIGAVTSGKYDLAVASRLLKPEWTKRGLKREMISRAYNRLVRACFGTSFSDAQCAFKAISMATARRLLPLVRDNGWFFDTELLVCAERLGYRILDLPVRWVGNPDSRVRIVRMALEDLKGLWRLRRELGGRRTRTAVPKGIDDGCSTAVVGPDAGKRHECKQR